MTEEVDYQELGRQFLANWETDDATKHDIPLLMEALDRYLAEKWHNTGFEILMTELVSHPGMEKDTLLNLIAIGRVVGLDVRVLLMNLLNLAFGMGHILGEGPEHIKQCTCEYDEETDAIPR